MMRKLDLAAATIVTLGSALVVGGTVNAAQPTTKFAAGSKWTVKSESCPIREIFGSPGHLTYVFLNPSPHAPGTYKTNGKTITEKAPGYAPGPLASAGRGRRPGHKYVGTLTLGLNHFPAILSPGVVKGCPTYRGL
jgi:hypothetical protein